MKRREFIVNAAAAVASLAGAKAKAASPCPPPKLTLGSGASVSTTCQGPPSWVPSPGQWAKVGLNRVIDVAAATPATGDSLTTNPTWIEIWGGGAYTTAIGGAYGAILYGPAGGHQTYDGNEVYYYDIETRRCVKLTDPYSPTTDSTNTTYGEWPDGSPVSPHTYDSVHVLPNVGASGTLVLPATYPDPNSSTYVGWSHLLDLSTKTWRRGPAYPGSEHHICGEYDSSRDVLWLRGDWNGGTAYLVKFDGTRFTSYTSNNLPSYAQSVATIDTGRDQFVHYFYDGASHPRYLQVTDLTAPNTQTTPIDLSGGPGTCCSLTYCPDTDKIMGWDGLGGSTVYTLDPSNYSGGWSSEGSSSSVTPPACNDGAFSKYQYVSAVKCLIGVSSARDYAYAYRPMGT